MSVAINWANKMQLTSVTLWLVFQYPVTNNVRYSDGVSYVCIVRSGSLSVTSNAATITVYGKMNYNS